MVVENEVDEFEPSVPAENLDVAKMQLLGAMFRGHGCRTFGFVHQE